MSDELYAATARRMMEAHGYRALLLARTLAGGLAYAPTARTLKLAAGHCHDELEHYETLARLYESYTAHPLDPVVEQRLRESPASVAADWFELVALWTTLARADLWQLREHDACSFAPYRELSVRVARDEASYQGSIERALADVCRVGVTPAQQEFFARCVRSAVSSFGRPNTPGTAYAINTGLKKRDAAPVVRDFLDDISNVAAAAGLSLPDAVDVGTNGSG